MKVVIIVAVLCCLALQAHANCNLLSTAKIVGKLCLGSFGNNRNNQTLIDGFFGCYDQAPGKQQFVDCQTKAFGGPMSTVEAVKATCGKVATQISTYTGCLKEEFSKAEIDMDATVKQINDCQSKVMNIGPSLIPGCRN